MGFRKLFTLNFTTLVPVIVDPESDFTVSYPEEPSTMQVGLAFNELTPLQAGLGSEKYV